MNLLPILFVFAVVVLVAAVLIKVMASRRPLAPDAAQNVKLYTLRKAVLSPAERSFVGVLEQVLPENVGLLVKIRLGDVFITRTGLSASQRATAWNRINQKHVDFLLVRTHDLAPVAGIELDDSSHEANDRRERDRFVDEVFQSCDLPLLHVPARSTYNPTELRSLVESATAPQPTAGSGTIAPN